MSTSSIRPMRRRRTRPLALVLAALLVLAMAGPATAGAKGLVGLTVCGAGGCVDRTDRLPPSAALAEALLDGGDSVADPGPAPFVRLKEHMGDGTEELGLTTVVFFPGLGIEQFEDGTFHQISPAARRALRRIVGGIGPLLASALKADRSTLDEPVDAAAPLPGAPAVSSPATGRGSAGQDGNGGLPTGVWVGGGAVLLAALAAGGVAVARRRHRPAPGRPAIG